MKQKIEFYGEKGMAALSLMVKATKEEVQSEPNFALIYLKITKLQSWLLSATTDFAAATSTYLLVIQAHKLKYTQLMFKKLEITFNIKY